MQARTPCPLSHASAITALALLSQEDPLRTNVVFMPKKSNPYVHASIQMNANGLTKNTVERPAPNPNNVQLRRFFSSCVVVFTCSGRILRGALCIMYDQPGSVVAIISRKSPIEWANRIHGPTSHSCNRSTPQQPAQQTLPSRPLMANVRASAWRRPCQPRALRR